MGGSSNLSIASGYKNKIINILLNDKKLIRLIDPKPSECEYLDIIDVLLGGTWFYDGKEWKEHGHLFDYNFVKETTVEEKTFIFVETDIDTIKNRTFVDFNLYVFVFTPKELVRITDHSSPTVSQIKEMGFQADTYGNRIDALCEAIDDILNGNEKVNGIGTISPAPRGFCTLYRPNDNYYGKCLKYNITNLNDAGGSCGN